MGPHPDFADCDLPRHIDLAGFVLTPLSPEHAVEDFEAVRGSEAVMQGVFGGDWPVGLTLEDNRIDLAWHEREFTARRSFAWILRDDAQTYLGCVYIYPDLGRTGSAEVVTWIVDRADRIALSARLTAVLVPWLETALPAGLSLRWTQSPALT